MLIRPKVQTNKLARSAGRRSRGKKLILAGARRALSRVVGFPLIDRGIASHRPLGDLPGFPLLTLRCVDLDPHLYPQ